MSAAKRVFSDRFSLVGVTCRRGGRRLFQNITLQLSPGDIVALTGPNGAGKTSFLRIAASALPLDEGAVLWNNAPCVSGTPLQHACFMPADDAYLKPQETVRENMEFWVPASDNIPQSLARAGLAGLEDCRAQVLSAGQRRRLSLARVYAQDAALWLLDEPLTALDIRGQEDFYKALAAHAARGGMVIVAGHHELPASLLPGLRVIAIGAEVGA